MAAELFEIWTSPDTTQEAIQLSDVDSSSVGKVTLIRPSSCEISSSSVHEMGLFGEILNETQFPLCTPRSHPQDLYNSNVLSTCPSDGNIFWNATIPASSLDVHMNMEGTNDTNLSENEEILVNVTHEPLALVATPTPSMSGMTTGPSYAYGLDDIPTHGVSSSLEEINLDDVFQGWGESMHHLLWKIANPMVNIGAAYTIDDEVIEKLRRSVYGPFTHTHHQIAYTNSNLFLPIEGTAGHSCNSAAMDNATISPIPLLPMAMPIPKPVIYYSDNTRHLPRILSLSSKPKPMSSVVAPPSANSVLRSLFMDNNCCYPPSKEMSPPHTPFHNILPSSGSIVSNGLVLDTLEPLPKKKLWENKCDICGLVLLGGQQRFEAHVKNAHELKCICGLEFKFKIKLMKHIKQMASDSQDEGNEEDLGKHHGITPGDKMKPLFECDYCDEIFRNRNAAVKHRNHVHMHFVEASPEEKVLRTSSTKKKKTKSTTEEKVRTKGERKSKKSLILTSTGIKSVGGGNDEVLGGSSPTKLSAARRIRKKSQLTNSSKLTSLASTATHCTDPEKVPSTQYAAPAFNVSFNSQHSMCGGSVSVVSSGGHHAVGEWGHVGSVKTEGGFLTTTMESEVPGDLSLSLGEAVGLQGISRFSDWPNLSSINKQFSSICEHNQDVQINDFQLNSSNSHLNPHIFNGLMIPETCTNSSTIVANINTLPVVPRPSKKSKKITVAPRKRLKSMSSVNRSAEINMNEINALFVEAKPPGWVHCTHFNHDSELDHSFIH